MRTASQTILSLICLIATQVPVTAVAQDPIRNNAAEQLTSKNVVALQDQLINGLRVTTNEQKQFIGIVTAQVEQGRLSRSMINLVYEWALERNPKVPFPYFQFAMRNLAKRRGVLLP